MASFSEDFNVADALLPSAALNNTWTNVAGAFRVISNEVGRNDTTAARSRCETTFDSADQQAEIDVIILGSGQNAGVLVQYDSASDSGYLFYFRNSATTNTYRIARVTSGTFNVLGAAVVATPPALPLTLKIEKVGTTIRGLVNGTEVISRTDSTYSAHRRAGIYLSSASSNRLDDFAASDVTGVPGGTGGMFRGIIGNGLV